MASIGLDLYALQKDVEDYARSVINWEVWTGSLPTAESLPIVNGDMDPFVVMRFADLMPLSTDRSFKGAAYDGYYTYIDFMCVARTDAEARQLTNIVNQRMIGKSFQNSGELNKSPGGGRFAILNDSRIPAAYVAVTSYRLTTNIHDVGAKPSIS